MKKAEAEVFGGMEFLGIENVCPKDKRPTIIE